MVNEKGAGTARFGRKLLLAVLVGVGLFVLWMGRHVLLLAFAGLLLGLGLTTITLWARKVLPIPYPIVLGLVILLLLGLLTLGGWLLAAPLSQQFAQLSETIPKAFNSVKETVLASQWFLTVEDKLPDVAELLPGSGRTVSNITRFFSSGADAIAGMVVILFTGIFLAANPGLYKRGLLLLVPPHREGRALEIIDRLLCTLRYWLFGQIISMAVVGTTTAIGLYIIGIPLAGALGVVAGLLEFIPTIGPLLSAVPAILLAFTEGLDKVLIVVALFVGIQFFETNILMPIVQHHAVDLPPAVSLLTVVLLGTMFGFLGILVATPIAAAVLVLVQELYLRDTLKRGVPDDPPESVKIPSTPSVEWREN